VINDKSFDELYCRTPLEAYIDKNRKLCYTYNAYGKLVSRTGDSFVIFGYNGRDGVITDKNGLIYMRARYYSPDMHRFVNAEVLVET